MQSRRHCRWSYPLGALLVCATLPGCHRAGSPDAAQAPGVVKGSDPADANLALSDGSRPGRVSVPAPAHAGKFVIPQQTGGPATENTPRPAKELSSSAAAPIERRAPEPDDIGAVQQDLPAAEDLPSDNSYQTADLEVPGPGLVDASQQPPPPLPVYPQPPCPEPDSQWTPGYWNLAPAGYFWVPGAWVQPPFVGALWTPGYWGYYSHRYRFHHGYWARHVGFYGGVAYGFGYTGRGFHGGYWDGDHFRYNRAVTRLNPDRIHSTYSYPADARANPAANRISYNLGNGGTAARPVPAELAALREGRVAPVESQRRERAVAARAPDQFYRGTHGAPGALVAHHVLAAEPAIATPRVPEAPGGSSAVAASRGYGRRGQLPAGSLLTVPAAEQFHGQLAHPGPAPERLRPVIVPPRQTELAQASSPAGSLQTSSPAPGQTPAGAPRVHNHHELNPLPLRSAPLTSQPAGVAQQPDHAAHHLDSRAVRLDSRAVRPGGTGPAAQPTLDTGAASPQDPRSFPGRRQGDVQQHRLDAQRPAGEPRQLRRLEQIPGPHLAAGASRPGQAAPGTAAGAPAGPSRQGYNPGTRLTYNPATRNGPVDLNRSIPAGLPPREGDLEHRPGLSGRHLPTPEQIQRNAQTQPSRHLAAPERSTPVQGLPRGAAPLVQPVRPLAIQPRPVTPGVHAPGQPGAGHSPPATRSTPVSPAPHHSPQ